jgi:hypothetical protein
MPILGRIDSEKAVHFSTVRRLVCRYTIAKFFAFRNRLKTRKKRVDCSHITITIMSVLKSRDKAILEKIFRMGEGYVLDFSDRTMEAFFAEEFEIDVYDKKYDFDFPSRSKANRMRGIWRAEADAKVGSIILALIECAETAKLTKSQETTILEKELFQKGKDIGFQLLMGGLGIPHSPDVANLKNKATIVKGFNAFDIISLETNTKVYLLKVLFSYYEAILTAYYGQGLFFVTSGIDDLNDYFKVLRKRILELVASDAIFEDLQKSNGFSEIFEPITSLYSSAEFLDVVWDDSIHPLFISIREDIENNSEPHTYPLVVTDFLEVVSKEISSLESVLDRKRESFYKTELPKQKEAFEKAPNQPEKESVIRHEHIHSHYHKNDENAFPFKIEITQMPELSIKTSDESIVTKNKKKISLPKFPATDWNKVTVRFIDEQNVYITADTKTATADYETLGFRDDKSNKPNKAWEFFFALAQNNGETMTIPSPIPDTVKQKKRQLSDRLKTLFKNDTDPFYDFTETKTYKMKVKLIPPTKQNEDKYGVGEYLHETMSSE